MGPELLSHLVLLVAPLAAGTPLPPAATWDELVEIPDGRLGELVRLHVQAHSQPETWEPFLTRFSPGEYVALRAWTDQQLPWYREEYDHPRAVVFARRGTPAARRLLAAPRHQRLALGCIPRAYQAGMLWVEVVGACRSQRQIPEGSVLHVEKALRLIEREAPGLAREQLERALAAPLPEHARERVREIVASSGPPLGEVEARPASSR